MSTRALLQVHPPLYPNPVGFSPGFFLKGHSLGNMGGCEEGAASGTLASQPVCPEPAAEPTSVEETALQVLPEKATSRS